MTKLGTPASGAFRMEAAFQRRLYQARVPQVHQAGYHDWVALYLKFCSDFSCHGWCQTEESFLLFYLSDIELSLQHLAQLMLFSTP